jgi:hypothetical protein
MKRHPLLVLGLLSLAGSSLPAFTVEYNFFGYVGAAAEGVPTTVPGFVNAANLTRGPGLTGNTLANGFSSASWFGGVTGTEQTLATAIEFDKYYQVSFTVVGSAPVSFVALDAVLRQSSAAAVKSFEWQYSLDGFATPGVAFHSYDTGSQFVAADGNGVVAPTIDLSVLPALQDLTDGTTLTLRLYAWGASGGASTLAFGRSTVNSAGVDSALTLTVVPEPATYAMFSGLAAIGLLLVVRRRRA